MTSIEIMNQQLISAVKNGTYEIVEILIKAGADLNKANNNGETPLEYAVTKGHDNIVEILIKAGSDDHNTLLKVEENFSTNIMYLLIIKICLVMILIFIL